MKKIILALMIFSGWQASFGQTLQDIMVNLPNNNIFGVEPSIIQYLVENPTDSSRRTSNYIFQDLTREKISDDYVLIQTSEIGTTEVKILPLINDSKIICVLKTICSTICDSQIYFFTPKWEPISKEDLILPIEKDWFLKEDVDKSSEAYKVTLKELKNNFPILYQLSPESATLSLSINPKSFMDMETYKEVNKIFNSDAKILEWNKQKFK